MAKAIHFVSTSPSLIVIGPKEVKTGLLSNKVACYKLFFLLYFFAFSKYNTPTQGLCDLPDIAF